MQVISAAEGLDVFLHRDGGSALYRLKRRGNTLELPDGRSQLRHDSFANVQ